MTDRASHDILTIPNFVTLVRLLGIPLFLYLFLGVHAYVAASLVLAVGGVTDWVDGYLARRLGQTSPLGTLLDPLADRLYVVATLVAFTIGGIVPWPFTAALILRDFMVLGCLVMLRRPLPVHYVGKTATFTLLLAFPVLLLAHASASAAPVAWPLGWGLAWWGLCLYWVAGALYLIQTMHLTGVTHKPSRRPTP